MAITIPINNIPSTPLINMEEYKSRVEQYAAALWKQMLDAEMIRAEHKEIKHHSSARISALSLHGGKTISPNIDESEAIYLEKYANRLSHVM